MSWIDKIWPKRAKAKSKQGSDGALVPAYGQDIGQPDELISRANKRATRGDLEGAIADIDAALEMNPTQATTFYNRGYLHNLSGNYREAIQDCSEAIALLPEYDEAFYQRSIAKIELGNIEAAIVDLSEVLRLNPFSIKAYYKRASCYAAQKDIQGAVADYTQAILRVPKDFNAYIQRGLFLSQLQEHRTAIEDFSSALSLNPKSAEAYYHRGCCHAELGDKEKATQDFNQAMLYDPSQRAADYNRTYALGIIKESKNLPPASSPQETPTPVQDSDAVVLSLDPEQPTVVTPFEAASYSSETSSPISHANRNSAVPPAAPSMGVLVRQTNVDVLFLEGQKKVELGDFEGAIDAYTKILDYEPENARAYLERGKSLASIGETELADDDMNAAVRCAKQKSLELMKDYSGTLTETINTLKLDLKQPKESSAASPQVNQSIEAEIIKYSQAIHRNPLDTSAYFKRAQSRALLGDLDGAIADYTRTISLEPEHRDAYYKRGMLLDAMGDQDSATADLDRAIRRTHLLPSSEAKRSTQSVKTYEDAIAESIETPQNISTQSSHPQPHPAVISSDAADLEPSVSSPDEQATSIPEENANDLRESHLQNGAEVSKASPDRQPEPKETSNTINKDSLYPSGSSGALDAVTERNPVDEADPFSEGQRRNTLLQAEESLHSEAVDISSDPDDFEAEINEDLSEANEDIEQKIPTYFSDLVLDPCTHDGNDPKNRYCVHCGQPIEPSSDSPQSPPLS